MGKATKEYRPHNLKPVQRIELSEKNMKLRSVLAIVFLAIGAIALGLGFSSLFKSDPGWAVIEVNSSELNCSGEFVFNYCLGMSEASATSENKQLTDAYTELTTSAYKIFNGDKEFPGINNVYKLNNSLNVQTEVDPALYKALELVCSHDDRLLFLSALYAEYENLFFSPSSYMSADDADPYTNTETAAFFKEISEFISNKDHISIELLGNNSVKLNVSAEYSAYAAEYEISDFIGFSWFKNAFVIDYLADNLISRGFCYGNITSVDGFVRNLDNVSGQSYSLNLFTFDGEGVYISSRMNYSAPAAIVTFRDFPLADSESTRFYLKQNGGIVTQYADATDGLYRSATDSITLYSKSVHSCAEILLSSVNTYISDSLDTGDIKVLSDRGIHSVWCEDTVVKYTEKELIIEPVSYEDKIYTKAYAFD